MKITRAMVQEILSLKGKTLDEVINSARDPGMALHSSFEWDDAAAAHAQRKGHLKLIIRNIKSEWVDEIEKMTQN